MKVILIEHVSEDGWDDIVAVASSMEMADVLLGRMARAGKMGSSTKFNFREVEVDVDFVATWEGHVGKEIKEPVESVEP